MLLCYRLPIYDYPSPQESVLGNNTPVLPSCHDNNTAVVVDPGTILMHFPLHVTPKEPPPLSVQSTGCVFSHCANDNGHTSQDLWINMGNMSVMHSARHVS